MPLLTVITSPNGLFSLDVTNIGIFLTGPGGGRIELTTSQAIVKGAGVTTIDGAVVRLNNGGKPVARVGDVVQVNPLNGTGTIQTGATTVLA